VKYALGCYSTSAEQLFAQHIISWRIDMKKRLIYPLFVTLIIFLVSPVVHSQMTVEQILDRMVTEFEKGVQNIVDYTVTTNMYTAEYKKTYVDGRPTFKSRVRVRGMEQLSGGAISTSSMGHSEFYDSKMFDYLKENAEYRGIETLDGARTHTLFVAELRELVTEANADQAKNVHFYVDADTWVLRKMKFDVQMEDPPGKTQTMNASVSFQDFRNIEGMQIPFKTVMEMEGLDSAISEAEREEARKSMEELQKQLESMPAQQRRMMENMLGPQLRQLENMLAGEKFEIAIQVEEVKVNTGLSDDLFN
jgi:hypothetical protein